jgi:glycosyltransferase involved in cell wall biosynthesis
MERKNTMPSVSLIVPVYNVYEYVDKCIESLINQTMKDIEIIIINDGSIDNVEEKLEKWQRQDDRIKLINNTNHGVSYSRNLGIRLSRGEYISFIDSDDWCDIEMIEKLYSALIYNNADYAFCNRYSVYPDGKIVENVMQINLSKDTNLSKCKELLYKLFITSCDKMYKRNMLVDNNIFYPEDIRSGEDLILTTKVLTTAKKIVQVKDCLYYYRRNRPFSASDLTHNSVLEQKYAYIATIKYFKDNNIFEEYYYELEKYMIDSILWRIETAIDLYEKTLTIQIVDYYLKFLNTNFPKWRVNMYWNYSNEKICRKIGFFELIKTGRINNKPLVIFSASSGGKKMIEFLEKFSIKPSIICDNSKEMQNTYLNGVKIVSPEEMLQIYGTNINLLITSLTYYKEIKNQLIELGVPSQNIIL